MAERAAAGIKPAEPVFWGATTRPGSFSTVWDAEFSSVTSTIIGSVIAQRPIMPVDSTVRNDAFLYGWKFSSNMPDVYISRAGMDSKAGDEKFTQTELGTSKDELSKVKPAAKIKDERITALQQSLAEKQSCILLPSQRS